MDDTDEQRKKELIKRGVFEVEDYELEERRIKQENENEPIQYDKD